MAVAKVRSGCGCPVWGSNRSSGVDKRMLSHPPVSFLGLIVLPPSLKELLAIACAWNEVIPTRAFQGSLAHGSEETLDDACAQDNLSSVETYYPAAASSHMVSS